MIQDDSQLTFGWDPTGKDGKINKNVSPKEKATYEFIHLRDVSDLEILNIKSNTWLKLTHVIQKIILLTGTFNNDKVWLSNSQSI